VGTTAENATTRTAIEGTDRTRIGLSPGVPNGGAATDGFEQVTLVVIYPRSRGMQRARRRPRPWTAAIRLRARQGRGGPGLLGLAREFSRRTPLPVPSTGEVEPGPGDQRKPRSVDAVLEEGLGGAGAVDGGAHDAAGGAGALAAREQVREAPGAQGRAAGAPGPSSSSPPRRGWPRGRRSPGRPARSGRGRGRWRRARPTGAGNRRERGAYRSGSSRGRRRGSRGPRGSRARAGPGPCSRRRRVFGYERYLAVLGEGAALSRARGRGDTS
jgi:hypothetical protein